MRTLFPRCLSKKRGVTGSFVAILVTSCFAGCGSEFGATANGVVTLDGQPVTPGHVTFAADDPKAVPAVSDLDPNGGFELTTKKKPGLAPGTYTVAVQAFRPPDIPEGQRSFKPSEPLVPEKYMQTTTSGLQFTIEPGSNTIEIELVSD